MERKRLDEMDLSATSTLKPAEYSSITQGLKRLDYRLQKANTPVKIMDCIKLAKFLVDKWPLKSKIVWQTVSSGWDKRSTVSIEDEPDKTNIELSSEDEIDDFIIPEIDDTEE